MTTTANKPAAASARTTSNNAGGKPQKSLKKKTSEKKDKVVRDSFTMPKSDYALITELKDKALDNSLHVKKSELLRAGLRMLAKLNTSQLKRAVADLEKVKTGRPKKD